MKIATNIPESLSPSLAYQVFRIDEDKAIEATAIVISLEKNFGANSVDRINNLTYWLSRFPQEIPCYLVGCESTIPPSAVHDGTILKYKDNSRDEAIRKLCDEVLSRSNSIGVREHITYLHLTEIIGYKNDRIKIIYEKNKVNNQENLKDFIEDNNSLLKLIERDLLRFQTNPTVIYTPGKVTSKTITISKPHIEKVDKKVRVFSLIGIDDQHQKLWCETDEIYKHFLVTDRADAFVCAVLPFALRTGKDIVCEAPVTEQFLNNINKVLIPNLCKSDTRLHNVKVMASIATDSAICGNAVATGMSCGVDSFYTLIEYSNPNLNHLKLTHLYCGNYLYGNDSLIYKRAEKVADMVDLPLVETTTNINEFFSIPHIYIHFFKTMFGVLSLKKLFKTYIYSSAEDFTQFNMSDNSRRSTADFELLLLYTFSTQDFQILSGGGGASRLEKTTEICEHQVVNEYLNVCLYPNLDTNCGKCPKCLRTLLMIDMNDSLQKFKNVFDIKHYQANRLLAFKHLSKNKDYKMLAETYLYFSKHEPELIKLAESS